jgi:hydrogenase-4 component B
MEKINKRQTLINRILSSFTLQSSTLLLVFYIALVVFIALTVNYTSLAATLEQIPIISSVFRFLNNLQLVPFWIIFLPAIAGFLELGLGKLSFNLRDILVINTTFFIFLLVTAMYPAAVSGGLSVSFPNILGLGLSFRIDMLSFTMLLLTSIIWFLVMIYSHEYMTHEKHTNRFFLFMSLTYSSILGTIMAGDLLTLFLFFEGITIFAYFLVIHNQTREAFSAGYAYIFVGIIGGLALLTAIILLYTSIGRFDFSNAISELMPFGNLKYWIIGLIIFGFGAKAGMFPLHGWLPKAHPVAPSPASALLSGVIIKVGAFGILRTVIALFFPSELDFSIFGNVLWEPAQNLGFYIIWLALITMAVGVFLAIQQSNIKILLAYSSISQIGYILLGVGVALYLGELGAMGFTGAIYHIINHALFKSLLFMVAGIIYFYTGELDMYKLGGLYKKLPLVTIIFLIAALGITGMPLFNGFISKSILHHAIVEAADYGSDIFIYAEWGFNIISAGTVAYFAKFFYYTFLGKIPSKYESIQPRFKSLQTAMLTVALLIIGIGTNPRYLLNQFIVPALRATVYDNTFIDKYVLGLNFFNTSDLLTMLYIFIGGLTFFIIGNRLKWFNRSIPSWLRFGYIVFYPFNFGLRILSKLMAGTRYQTVAVNNSFNLRDPNKKETKVGVLEQFVNAVSAFNSRFETSFISSDVIIYALVIISLLIYILLLRF